MKRDLVLVYKSFAPVFPIASMVCSYNASMKKSIGVDAAFKQLYCIVRDGGCNWYFSREEVELIGKKTMEAICADEGIAENCKKNFLQASERLLELIERDKIAVELEYFAYQEISSLLEKALKLYQEAAYWVEPPNFSLEIRGQEIVRQMFNEFIKEKHSSLKESEKADSFVTLSNPASRSFVMDAELEQLKIAAMEDLEEKQTAIREYARKYYWLLYDYYGPIVDENTVREQVKVFEKLSEEELGERIKKIEEHEELAEKKLDSALYNLSLPKDLENAFKNIRELALVYGNTKKERISKANIGLGLMLKEIAKRTKIEEYALHFATTNELELLLKGKKINPAIFRGRIKKSAVACENVNYYFLSEKEVKEIEGRIITTVTEQLAIIKGMPACSGHYTGKARVIKDKKMLAGFEEGEVLVTTMTTVDFVPAMKVAGAIVTDIGGITCHAAIVSRELGVPCIIGTQNATELIKDGDTLEVNAKHGIVKVLKK